MDDIPLSAGLAAASRDALAKNTYALLFVWICDRINRGLGSDPSGGGGSGDGGRSLAILDIFGFEIFETNSFEQLCINFANEKLQRHFNDQVFRTEQSLYRRRAPSGSGSVKVASDGGLPS